MPDVMRLAMAGGSVAAGVLAVLVADDERFPLRGGRGRGGAADVEDFGAARDDDAADVAVAQQPVEHRLREAAVVAPLRNRAGDEIGRPLEVAFGVEHVADVRPDAVAFAGFAAVEVPAHDVG